MQDYKRTLNLAQVRKRAMALPDVTEEPHFDRTSFRVKGKIFVTAKPDEPYVHVFVADDVREPALAAKAPKAKGRPRR